MGKETMTRTRWICRLLRLDRPIGKQARGAMPSVHFELPRPIQLLLDSFPDMHEPIPILQPHLLLGSHEHAQRQADRLAGIPRLFNVTAGTLTPVCQTTDNRLSSLSCSGHGGTGKTRDNGRRWCSPRLDNPHNRAGHEQRWRVSA
jgi:hypothetical protein